MLNHAMIFLVTHPCLTSRVESVDPTKSSQQLLSLCSVACTICTIYMPTTYQAPSYLCACIKKYY